MKSEAATLSVLLEDAAQRLTASLNLDSRTARIEARVLAAHTLKVESAWLVAHATDVCSEICLADFNNLLARRLAGEPIAYLTGLREFYSQAFQVTPDVLIPRPETELLVERALVHILPHVELDVLELGCGSGCVAISLALQRPQAHITAIDCSSAALAVARSNANRLNANVDFLSSDWYAELSGRQFDMIVANPPYVAHDDVHLECGDVRFEPMGALVSGRDGLDALRHIVKYAPLHLRRPGYLLLEHGYDQAEPVQRLIALAGMSSIQTWPDLAGILRVTGGELSK